MRTHTALSIVRAISPSVSRGVLGWNPRCLSHRRYSVNICWMQEWIHGKCVWSDIVNQLNHSFRFFWTQSPHQSLGSTGVCMDDELYSRPLDSTSPPEPVVHLKFPLFGARALQSLFSHSPDLVWSPLGAQKGREVTVYWDNNTCAFWFKKKRNV